MRHEEHWFGAQPGKQRMIIIVINMINISFCSMSKGICVVARRNVIVYCPGHRYLKSFLVSLRSHRRRRCKAPVTTHYSRLWLIIEFGYLRALFVSRIITTNPWPPHELPNTDSPQTHPTPCPRTSLQLDTHIRLVSIQALNHLTSTQHREPPHLHTTHPDTWDFDMYSHPFINKTGSATLLLPRQGQPRVHCSHCFITNMKPGTLSSTRPDQPRFQDGASQTFIAAIVITKMNAFMAATFNAKTKPATLSSTSYDVILICTTGTWGFYLQQAHGILISTAGAYIITSTWWISFTMTAGIRVTHTCL